MTGPRQVAILGSTGSIGRSTLDVLARHHARYRVRTLIAGSGAEALFEQCRSWQPERAILADEAAAERLQRRLAEIGSDTQVEQGGDAIRAAAGDPANDIVVSAIVGAAGLEPTLAAARAGKRLLLANKESLVMSGEILMRAVAESGAVLMPVDSEHNAIFQSLPQSSDGVNLDGVESLVLTASGGPFRTTPAEALAVVTPQQALKHPNWSMGPKITIDSATLMNKGLEFIEAAHLFALPADRIEVLVHPESVIHSMVRYRDGSVLAQLGQPDMRTPIAHALAWPERIESGVAPLDFTRLAGLHFETPDLGRFPALGLAIDAQRRGGTAPVALNAANEVAVDAFLAGRVSFMQLPALVERVLEQARIVAVDTVSTIIEADRAARELARDCLDSP